MHWAPCSPATNVSAQGDYWRWRSSSSATPAPQWQWANPATSPLQAQLMYMHTQKHKVNKNVIPRIADSPATYSDPSGSTTAVSRVRRKFTVSGNLFSLEVFVVVSKVFFVLTAGGDRVRWLQAKWCSCAKPSGEYKGWGLSWQTWRGRGHVFKSYMCLSHMRQRMYMHMPHIKNVEIKQGAWVKRGIFLLLQWDELCALQPLPVPTAQTDSQQLIFNIPEWMTRRHGTRAWNHFCRAWVRNFLHGPAWIRSIFT